MVASSIAQVMGLISIGSVFLLVAGTPIYIAAAELRARKPKAKTPRSAVVESQTAASVA